MHRHAKELQGKITPDIAFQFLKEGNDRFVGNLRVNHDFLQQKNETREAQFPFATILSCMDSRTSAELIFDQGLGDVFSIRIAGNVLNEDVLGSMEYATKVVGTKILVVLGHTNCGAIIGACNDVKLGHLTQLVEKIKPAIERETTTQTERNGKNTQYVRRVTELNVHLTIDQIKEKSPVIAELVNQEDIKIVGGIYDLDTGKVEFFDE